MATLARRASIVDIATSGGYRKKDDVPQEDPKPLTTEEMWGDVGLMSSRAAPASSTSNGVEVSDQHYWQRSNLASDESQPTEDRVDGPVHQGMLYPKTKRGRIGSRRHVELLADGSLTARRTKKGPVRRVIRDIERVHIKPDGVTLVVHCSNHKIKLVAPNVDAARMWQAVITETGGVTHGLNGQLQENGNYDDYDDEDDDDFGWDDAEPGSPMAIANLPNLSGTIPYTISGLTSLEELWLSGTQLSGTLPAAFASLTNLGEFALDTDGSYGAEAAQQSTETSYDGHSQNGRVHAAREGMQNGGGPKPLTRQRTMSRQARRRARARQHSKRSRPASLNDKQHGTERPDATKTRLTDMLDEPEPAPSIGDDDQQNSEDAGSWGGHSGDGLQAAEAPGEHDSSHVAPEASLRHDRYAPHPSTYETFSYYARPPPSPPSKPWHTRGSDQFNSAPAYRPPPHPPHEVRPPGVTPPHHMLYFEDPDHYDNLYMKTKAAADYALQASRHHYNAYFQQALGDVAPAQNISHLHSVHSAPNANGSSTRVEYRRGAPNMGLGIGRR